MGHSQGTTFQMWDKDGDEEIRIGGVETEGLMRGPAAYQLYESDESLLLTKFVLNSDF